MINKIIAFSLLLLFAIRFSAVFAQDDSSGSMTDSQQAFTNPNEVLNTNSDSFTNPDLGVKEEINPVQIGYDFFFAADVINNSDYNTFQYKPNLTIGDFNMCLDFNFDYDESGHLCLSEWNTWQAVVSKIQNIQYGEENGPLLIKLGILSNFTLGDGFIVKGYSDIFNYPDLRLIVSTNKLSNQIITTNSTIMTNYGSPYYQYTTNYANNPGVNPVGMIASLDLGIAGLKLFTDNILDWDLTGARAFVRPLFYLNVPIIKNMEFGATAVEDMNPFFSVPPLPAPYQFILTNTGSNVLITGLDAKIPAADFSNIFSFAFIGDYADIANNGSGMRFGGEGKLSSFFPFRIGLDYSQPGFIPSYFDVFYNADRIFKFGSLNTLTTNDLTWFFSAGLNILDGAMVMNYAMNQSLSNNAAPEIKMDLNISRKLIFDMIGIDLSLTRRDVTNAIDLFNMDNGNSVFNFSLDYVIMNNIIVNLSYTADYEVDSYGNVNPLIYSIVSTEILF